VFNTFAEAKLLIEQWRVHYNNQRTEAKVGCNVLNRMTGLGMPASVRIR
jgi:hypothetical protein